MRHAFFVLRSVVRKVRCCGRHRDNRNARRQIVRSSGVLMKPSAFEYKSPTTLAEAVSLLKAGDGNAKLISGGQSLMPMLAFRLAAPELLVDLKRIPDLNGIGIGDDGVRLGAKVRWCDIASHHELSKAHPLLAAAIRHVAHYQIRNRGPVGSSLAH